MIKNFKQQINDSVTLKKKLLAYEKKIFKAVNLIYDCIKKENKVLICGNGGSAADAQHLAAEFLIRLKPNVNRKPYPVITLAQDVSTITACGNDLGFDNLFQRNFEALARKDDLLIVISTSGNSKNIINVLKFAKKKGYKSIALLGNKGGKAKNLSYLEIIVPSKNTARIQESQIFLGHFIFEQVEKKLLS